MMKYHGKIMKYHGKIMEFCYEMPVWTSLGFFLARLHEVHRAIVVTSVVRVYVYVYVYVRVTLSVKVF